MKELVSHISYLIQQNDCVVIPNLGGFVLSRQAASITEDEVFLSPSVRLGFNSELRHNDGLLIESYMRTCSISCDTASDKINLAVKKIKTALMSGEVVDCGALGQLKYIDKHIVFEPDNSSFIHNSVWGFVPLSMDKVSDLKSNENRHAFASAKWLNRSLAVTASAVAVVALLCFPVSSDSNVLNRVQQSGFFIDNFVPVAKKFGERTVVMANQMSSVIDDLIEQKKNIIQNESAIDTSLNNKTITFEGPTRRYYIVVAGDSNKSRASRLLSSFKDKGFSNSQIVESKGMYRVFVASFTDKYEANAYLDSFRGKYASYKDAWLFSKRQS